MFKDYPLVPLCVDTELLLSESNGHLDHYAVKQVHRSLIFFLSVEVITNFEISCFILVFEQMGYVVSNDDVGYCDHE
jgi:hypothetical protein